MAVVSDTTLAMVEQWETLNLAVTLPFERIIRTFSAFHPAEKDGLAALEHSAEIVTSCGLMSYRAVHALYQAFRSHGVTVDHALAFKRRPEDANWQRGEAGNVKNSLPGR
jgi:hypothetical protein